MQLGGGDAPPGPGPDDGPGRPGPSSPGTNSSSTSSSSSSSGLDDGGSDGAPPGAGPAGLAGPLAAPSVVARTGTASSIDNCNAGVVEHLWRKHALEFLKIRYHDALDAGQESVFSVGPTQLGSSALFFETLSAVVNPPPPLHDVAAGDGFLFQSDEVHMEGVEWFEEQQEGLSEQHGFLFFTILAEAP